MNQNRFYVRMFMKSCILLRENIVRVFENRLLEAFRQYRGCDNITRSNSDIKGFRSEV